MTKMERRTGREKSNASRQCRLAPRCFPARSLAKRINRLKNPMRTTVANEPAMRSRAGRQLSHCRRKASIARALMKKPKSSSFHNQDVRVVCKGCSPVKRWIVFRWCLESRVALTVYCLCTLFLLPESLLPGVLSQAWSPFEIIDSNHEYYQRLTYPESSFPGCR